MPDASRDADADGKALIPAFIAQTGGVAETNEQLVGDDQTFDQSMAVGVGGLGDRQERAQAIAWMTARILVVEIQIADHRGIHERRAFGAGTLAVTNDASRKTLRRSTAGETESHLCGFAVLRRDGASQSVDDKSAGCSYHGLW